MIIHFQFLLGISQKTFKLSTVLCLLYTHVSPGCMLAVVCGFYVSQKFPAHGIICDYFLDALKTYFIFYIVVPYTQQLLTINMTSGKEKFAICENLWAFEGQR